MGSSNFFVLLWIRGGNLAAVSMNMKIAKEVVAVSQKYNLTALSKLAQRFVVSHSIIEQFQKLLDETLDRINKLCQHTGYPQKEHATFLSILQEQLFDIIEGTLSLVFHVVKHYKLLLSHQKKELIDYVVVKVPDILTKVATIMNNINEWFFSQLSKEERKETAEYIMEKIPHLLSRVSELAKRCQVVLSRLDSTDFAIKFGVMAPLKVEDFLNWWAYSYEKFQNISRKSFHSKLKKDVKNFERFSQAIKNVLTTEWSQLKVNIESIVSQIIQSLCNDELLATLRSLYNQVKEDATWGITVLLHDCPNVKLFPLVKEMINYLATEPTKVTTGHNLPTSWGSNVTVESADFAVPSVYDIQTSSLDSAYFENEVQFYQEQLDIDQMCLFDKEEWSDITFSFATATGTKTIRAHRVLLAACSIIFQRMFLGGFRESTQTIVPVEETDFDTFHMMLHFIYNKGNLRKILQTKETKVSSVGVEDRVIALLIAAHKFQVDALTAECEEYLISQMSKMELGDIVSLLALANMYHASNLKSACLQYTNRYLIDPNTLDPNLSADLKKEIIESRQQFLEQLFKVNAFVVSGKSGVGKTSFVNAALSPTDEDAVCNVEYLKKTGKKIVDVPHSSKDRAVELHLNEVSVKDVENIIPQQLNHYPMEDINAILCLFSLSDPESLLQAKLLLRQWTTKRNYELIREVMAEECTFERYKAGFHHLPKVVVLIGNKCDLPLPSSIIVPGAETRNLTAHDVQTATNSILVPFIATSAVTSENIVKLIQRVARVAIVLNDILGLKPKRSLHSKDPNKHTFILLGTDGVGKSTIFKQIKCIFGKKFLTSIEKKETREGIASQVVSELRKLVRIAQTEVASGKSAYQLEPHSQEIIEAHDWITSDKWTTGLYFDQNSAFVSTQLWNDPALQLIYAERAAFNLRLDIKPIFSHVVVAAETASQPTLQDYIYCYRPTDKSQSCEGIYMAKKFRFIDVGGRPSDREKWKDLVVSADAIIYIVSLADYAFTSESEGKENRLLESLALWRGLCKNLPQAMPICLVFNKVDDFKTLLETCKLMT
jgi:GTPase SAR1 family protein